MCNCIRQERRYQFWRPNSFSFPSFFFFFFFSSSRSPSHKLGTQEQAVCGKQGRKMQQRGIEIRKISNFSLQKKAAKSEGNPLLGHWYPDRNREREREREREACMRHVRMEAAAAWVKEKMKIRMESGKVHTHRMSCSMWMGLRVHVRADGVHRHDWVQFSLSLSLSLSPIFSLLVIKQTTDVPSPSGSAIHHFFGQHFSSHFFSLSLSPFLSMYILWRCL